MIKYLTFLNLIAVGLVLCFAVNIAAYLAGGDVKLSDLDADFISIIVLFIFIEVLEIKQKLIDGEKK